MTQQQGRPACKTPTSKWSLDGLNPRLVSRSSCLQHFFKINWMLFLVPNQKIPAAQKA